MVNFYNYLTKVFQSKYLLIVLVILTSLLVYIAYNKFISLEFSEINNNNNDDYKNAINFDLQNAENRFILIKNLSHNQNLIIKYPVKKNKIDDSNPTKEILDNKKQENVKEINNNNTVLNQNLSSQNQSVLLSNSEHRDNERRNIFKILIELIEEYLFYYDKLPMIYTNKSNEALGNNPSGVLFFYNDSENKVNAMSLNLGNDSYKFIRIQSNCENINLSDYSENMILIYYDPNNYYISMCLESNQKMEYYLE